MLIDCDPYNNGCNGGDYTDGWRYVKEKGGVVKSANYPQVSGTAGNVAVISRGERDDWRSNLFVDVVGLERHLQFQQLFSRCQSFVLWLGNAVPQRKGYHGPSAEWRALARFHESSRPIFRLRVRRNHLSERWIFFAVHTVTW